MSMVSVSSTNVLFPFRTSSASASVCLSLKANVLTSTPTPTHKHSSAAISSRSIAAFARRRKTDSPLSSVQKKKNVSVEEKDDVDGDAFEALFAQLEEDLKNDPSIEDEEGNLTEKELAKLQCQLEEAMFEDDDDDLFKLLGAAAGGAIDDEDGDDGEVKGKEDEEEEEDEDKSVKLKSWQLRRLARALKVGRRKTSIKSLAAELCLDRALVLNMLRDPPPKLLMMSAMLSDEPVQPAFLEPAVKPVDLVESVPEKKPVTDVKVPIHAMQRQWSTQKRLKKVQVQTLERVYRRTKRPTNTMVNSIVHVTNLPRKKVVKWFEDKRDEDGVPNERLPYERSTPETVFSK